MDKNTSGALVALVFFAGSIVCWPASWSAGLPLAAFVAHGVVAWRGLAGCHRSWLWWGLPALLAACWRLPLPQALAWGGALLLLPYWLRRLFLPLPQRSDTVFALFSLLGRSLPPALLPVAALGLSQPLPWHTLLLAALQSWLSLFLLIPLAWSALPQGRACRQLLALLLACVPATLLLGMLSAQDIGLFGVLLLLPLPLLAAWCAGLAGLGCVLVSQLLLLSAGVLPGMHGGLADTQLAVLPLWLFALLGWGVMLVLEQNRRRERLLQDVQARFESLLNQSSSLMTLKDLDGRYLLVNLNFARLFGQPVPYFKGRCARDIFSAEEARLIGEHDLQVLRSLAARQFEEIITVDGQQLRMLSSVFPLFDSEGLPCGVGSISVDITRRAEDERLQREAVEKYRAVVEQSLVGIYITQGDALVYVNPKLADMVRYPAEALTGRSIATVLPPGEDERIRAQIRRRISNHIQNMHYSTRLLRKDGEVIDVEIHSRLFDYQGRKALIGVVMDISDRVAASAELKLAATVFDNATEGILVTDADGRIVMVNQAFTRITGFAADEAIGRISRMLRTANRERNRALIEALSRDGHWKGEMFDRHKNGDPYVAELSISAVRSPGGALSHYVGVFSDITGRKQAEDRLQFLASHDPLTRLPNRSALIEAIDNTIIAASDEVPALALMFIDLDRFKLINDSFGHQAGDEVLHEIAARLSQCTARFGLVARLGGDEFTLLVRDFDSHEALARMAEEVLAALARPMHVEQHEVFVSGSIGISVYPNDGIDASTLLKNADAAMYRAKEVGKNTYQFFDAGMNAQTFERLLMESGLRLALERGEFELHYQPQLSCSGALLQGVEALIRWRHPQLGLVPPARFIPLAEETGLIKPIGAWVLREACRQLVAWDRAGLRIPRLAVNLSARQFEQQTLLREVTEVLAATGIAASRLELEITESMLMQNPQEAVSLLGELKALGVKLSIDDFGTGYSSLSTLKRFPLDYLKVDRSFIEGLPDDRDSAAITEAIIAMARKLHFTVIAEGVETAAQGAFLRQAGCAILQGYYFSKPLPAPALADWLRQREPQTAECLSYEDEL